MHPCPPARLGGSKGGERPPFVVQRNARSAYLIIPAQVTPRGTRRAVDAVAYLAMGRRALAAGATMVRPRVFHWNTAPWCDNPFETVVECHDRIGLARSGVRLDRTSHGWIEIQTACRRCDGCAKHRRALWTARARSEIAASYRTWMVTLTLHPHYQAVSRMQARKEVGPAWATMPDVERALAQHAVISKEITRYLKRVRKNSGCHIRYLLVLEFHKSGLPHYHLLVHEPDASRGVTWRDLMTPWTWGFATAKLVDGPQGANYVAKYLTKALRARVRASVGYGSSE